MNKITGDTQSLTSGVKDIVDQTEFFLTTVYALNTRKERILLWNHLWSISIGSNTPWPILGNLNSVLQPNDRIGGKLSA